MPLLERRPSILLDLAGAVLLVCSLSTMTSALGNPVGYYDEGIILTDAKMIGWGYFPYRDFYSNYPPGVFLTVLALWKLFGVGALGVRLLGVLVHVAIAVLCGRLAGRLAGRRFSLFSAAIVLAWLIRLPVGASAWLVALAILLGFIEIVASRPALGPARSAAAGVALGLVSFYRHDLFCYVVTALVLVFGTYHLARKLRLPLHWRWLALGVATPLALLWIPTFAGAGIRQVVTDLVLDQVRYVLPARETPWPDLLTLHHRFFPAFIGQLFTGALALTVVGPLLVLLAGRGRGELVTVRLALAAAAFAVIPQAAGRIDLTHVLYTVAPALVLVTAFIESLAAGWTWRWLPALALSALLIAPIWTLVWPPARFQWPKEPPLSGAQQMLVEYVRRNTSEGEAIYVGYRQHRHLLISEMVLYYYFDRPGATRYMQFDPNVVTRADVQAEMAGELEEQHVRWLVLATEGGFWIEPNLSNRVGADVLDNYIEKNFERVMTFGPYEVHQRRSM